LSVFRYRILPMLKTLAIIKPDAVKKNLIGNILSKAEETGLRITAFKMVHLTKTEAGEFYAVHKNKEFYGHLTDFMSEGPIVAIIFEGEDSINKWRSLMGATNPVKAATGTIRQLYGESLSRNAVHGSDSISSAEQEISFFSKVLSLR
jgi:nucleoside-diphosphate kinase